MCFEKLPKGLRSFGGNRDANFTLVNSAGPQDVMVLHHLLLRESAAKVCPKRTYFIRPNIFGAAPAETEAKAGRPQDCRRRSRLSPAVFLLLNSYFLLFSRRVAISRIWAIVFDV